MDSEESKWLKKRYREAPQEGAGAKRVKFQSIHEEISSSFPQKAFSYQMVSAAVKEAFPLSTSKKCGKTRAVHVFGIEPMSEQEQPLDIDTASQKSEGTPSSSSSESVISADSRALLERIKQLEEEVSRLQQSTLTLPNLSDQLHHVMFQPTQCTMVQTQLSIFKSSHVTSW